MSTIDQTQFTSTAVELYQSSYIDRFMRFIQRLRAPYWIVYLVFFFAQALINHIVSWLEGWVPLFTFDRILLLYPVWLWIPLIIMTFLNHTSLSAIQNFRPLLDLDDEALARLKAEFTTMPPRGVIATSLFWSVSALAVTLIYHEAYTAYGFGPISKWLGILQGLVSFSIGGVMYFHSLRQLLLIHRTVKTVKRVNLFALDPVYAFSRLTSRTGISWMVMLVLNFLLFPFTLAPGVMLTFGMVILIFALAAFVLPLRVVNQKLVLEKRSRLAEHQRRVENILARLHRQLDTGETADLDQYEKGIASLTAERKILDDIPTWPWRGATLTGFLSALIVPVFLMLIQFAIERWFSR